MRRQHWVYTIWRWWYGRGGYRLWWRLEQPYWRLYWRLRTVGRNLWPVRLWGRWKQPRQAKQVWLKRQAKFADQNRRAIYRQYRIWR